MSNRHFYWTFFHAVTKCMIQNVLSSGLWCAGNVYHYISLYIIFTISSGAQKCLFNCQSKYGLTICLIKNGAGNNGNL